MGEDTTQEFPKNSLPVILARFDSLEGSFRSEIGFLNSRVDSFDLRLTAIDEKVERRLMETRPIWELVLSRLDSVDNRLDSLDTRVGSLDTRVGSLDTRVGSLDARVGSVESQIGLLVKGFDRIEEEFENLGLKFRTFQNDLLRMQTRQEKLTERIERIENPPTA